MSGVPFGRHLHTQVILPLAVVAVMIAVSTAIIAMQIIDSQVVRWIDESASSAASVVTTRIGHRSASVERSLELISTDPRFVEAVQEDDTVAIADYLAFAAAAIRADTLVLLGADGRVVESSGEPGVAIGSAPFGPLPETGLPPWIDGRHLMRVGDLPAVVSGVSLDGSAGATWYLVASTYMRDELIANLALGLDATIVLLDGRGELISLSSPAGLQPDEFTVGDAAEALGAAAVRTATDDSDTQGEPLMIGGEDYRVAASALHPGGSDPDEAYVVAVVDTRLARDARATTAYIMVMWAIVGCCALIALNWYLAQKVSRPIAQLSEGAARVAGGDLTPTFAVIGHNEIAGLADNFNRMTASLKERSDSLTKKVLELATLYEMSRSLGSTLELETLLDSVLDSAMRIFDVEIGYVAMVDRESGAIDLTSWRGIDLSRSEETTLRSSMSDWVVREGRPLIFNPSVDDRGTEAGGEAERTHSDSLSGARAALCVPLLSSDGTIGAITVGTRRPEQRFTSDDVRLLATIANHVTIAVGNIGLFSSVQEAYLATVRALAAAIDAKDPYTRGHSDGVAAYALRIGEAMGLSAEQMMALEMAAYLHDIGKIGVSEDILLKPGKLTDAEMSQMRHHPLIGASILKPVAFPWPITPIVRHHHEHYNGEGYPAGLRNEEIPILARVLTVADAFEAMVADRPYRRGRSSHEAILELRRCAGTHFDPKVVDAFVRVLESAEADVADAPFAEGDIGPEETQAVLVALCDGMFTSFRRLGGPRLANNLEAAVNDTFLERAVPLRFRAGHLSASGDAELTEDEFTAHLTHAIGIISECVEGASGAGLADHFLSDALGALPERMRACAAHLGLSPSS